jgi:hypothetical protein
MKWYHASIKAYVAALSVDCWSDAKSDSLLGLGLNVHGKGYLLDLVDTNEAHTSDNMFPVLLAQMKVLREEAGCTVATLVSDKAANMHNTRQLVVAAQLKEVDSLMKVVETLEPGTPKHTEAMLQLQDARGRVVVDSYGWVLAPARGFEPMGCGNIA